MRKPTPEILRACLKKINAAAPLDSLSDSEGLYDRGVLDSLNIIQFVLALEESLDFEFKYENINYENFYSLDRLLDLLQKEFQGSGG